ncbi:MAG TPA: cystathionine beta-lyase [Gammaproteobacteria bacterium]|nr:cystathionine beta-lyase [Gammaproteobacteria bacterium]
MKKDTQLVEAGRDPAAHHGTVNPPVYHASTVLFPTLGALREAGRHPFEGVFYGRHGTPTTFAFERAMAELEGAHGAVAVSSGLAAIALCLCAFVQRGDHLLVSDNVYGPTRRFCDGTLAGFGVETTYFDPAAGAGIAGLFRENTRLVFMESPGSLTFEVQDVPAIAAAARRRGVLSAIDNTWATPLYFNAIAHGVDLSIHAATKYIVGHSDAMLGVINATEGAWEPLRRRVAAFGNCPGADELYLGLRGLRTLGVRLARHQETALALADWLSGRPGVQRVLYPALPSDPGHALWKRDFAGASGLFGVLLEPVPDAALARMLDHLELFGMGYSWGGFESLILPTRPEPLRSAVPWREEGTLLRIHAGLEDPDDLRRDLEAGLERLRRAAE